ncbi:hypothetical protein [Haloarcula argentinensis]|uniref:Cell surface glycoprotein n=1 Tax=Haloarcula argentinensis TaxID=43776 RepID=A0ABU2EYD5_HALAR|nr:hypothetical protein [Haloarcula argentinensis]EMA24642.1 hypothetical protein C443_05769 [Haloarcula argentinensis DSM 12282]MDS0253242.1 hypothetical protein [Haloarcula argentinensis]
MRVQISAVLLALVLVASPISMVAGPGVIGPASAQTGAPDGMVTIPDTNVVEDLPVGASSQLTKADLEGSVMASRDADSLQVIVTTPERASGYVNGSRVSGSGDRALVFRDNSSHEGRDVAVPADAVRETVGHVPNVVHGVHEDGTSWTAEVEARNGLLIFNIPHFSSNSVTFEGEVNIQETPAVDGSQINYQVEDSSNAGDFNINVTGVDSTETDTVTGAALSNGETLDLAVAGTGQGTGASVTWTGYEETTAASGSGTGSGTVSAGGNVNPTDEKASVTGDTSTTAASDSGTLSAGGSDSLNLDGNLNPDNEQLTVSGGGSYSQGGESVGFDVLEKDGDGDAESLLTNVPDGKITQITFNMVSTGTGDGKAEIWLERGSSLDGDEKEGTRVATGVTFQNSQTTVNIDDWDPNGADNVTIGITQTSASATTVRAYRGGGVPKSMFIDGYIYDDVMDIDYKTASDVTISSDSGTSKSFFVEGGGSQTKSFPVNLGDSISASGAGTVDYTLDYSARYGTEDPKIDIDGDGTYEASWSGVYKSGETTTEKAVDGLSTGDNSVSTTTASGPDPSWTLSWTERTATVDPAIDVDGDGTNEASYSGKLTEGSTATKSLPDLSKGSTGTVSTSAGSVDTQVSYTEHTATRDPAVLVNGNETEHLGTLSPGSTTSLATDTAWIQDGSNNITVVVGDGTLSSDAPTPAVDLEYTHSASVIVSTTYAANGWEESYNVSHTFAGDRENAKLRIPFSQRIYQVTHVEKSVNGGSWQSVSSSSWELQNGTDLVVQLKDTDGTADVVEAGDKVAIRTAGNKFQTTNGAISITDPTTPDDEGLDTGFRVDSKSTEFRLEVGGTPLGDQVHYTHTESWEAPEDRAVLSADGSQELYLPNAQTGGSARVTTIPLEPQLDSGDVGIQVVDPDNPTLAVGPGESGSGAAVQYRWHDAVPGEQYGLYSLGKERYVDKKDAGKSYVQLADDDSQETLVIKQPDGSSGGSSSSGGGISSGNWDNGEDGIDLQQIAVIAGWAVFSLLLVAATGRSSLSGRPRWILVGAVSGGLGLLALEILRPGAVSGALNAGIQEIVPLAGLAGIGIAAYSVVQWWQARREEATTPDTQVVLGGNSD